MYGIKSDNNTEGAQTKRKCAVEYEFIQFFQCPTMKQGTSKFDLSIFFRFCGKVFAVLIVH